MIYPDILNYSRPKGTSAVHTRTRVLDLEQLSCDTFKINMQHQMCYYHNCFEHHEYSTK